MAWTGRHNSNSACTHSQTSLEFDNLTVTRKFPMWLVSTAASRSKLAMRQCSRHCRRCRRRKTKGRRQCRHPWQAPGTATFRAGRARDFLPYVQKKTFATADLYKSGFRSPRAGCDRWSAAVRWLLKSGYCRMDATAAFGLLSVGSRLELKHAHQERT